MILAFTLSLLGQQPVPLPQSMDLALHGQPAAQSLGAGSGGRATSACDDFNRADGPVGANWTEVVGTRAIASNTVVNVGSGNGWMRFNGATGSHMTSVMELDVLANPTGSSRLSALIMGENAGTGDSVYVKVQNQTGLAGFSHYAFYRAYTGGSSGGWGGFFGFGSQLDAANDGLHMRVSHDGAGVTYLEIDDDLNGLYEYSFSSGASTTATGYTYGSGYGYGSWSAGAADNWELNGGCSGPVFTLSKTGTCPGPVTVTTTNGTAGAVHVFLYGGVGSFTIPGGSCGGTVLGLSSPTIGALVGANGSGSASASVNSKPAWCGLTIQVIEAGTCATTNTVTL